MKVASWGSCKGGVGKSILCTNVGAVLAKRGKKVLIIDCDPQCNASESLGVSLLNDQGIPNIDSDSSSCMLFQPDFTNVNNIIIGGDNPEDCLFPEVPTLHLIPGHTRLVYTDRELVRGLLSKSEEYSEACVLRNVFLNNFDAFDQYDYVFFDLNTYMSQVNENIFQVIDTFCAVTDPSYEGLMGISTFSGLWSRISDELGLEINFDTAIILNKFKRSTRMGKKVYGILTGEDMTESEEIIYSDYKKFFVNYPIPETVKFAESSFTGIPLAISSRPDQKKIIRDLENLTDALIEGGYL